MSLVVKGHIRGRYMCTQCLGVHQPKEGPDADVLVVLYERGHEGDEEYVCKPCAEKIAEGGELYALKIDVPPKGRS